MTTTTPQYRIQVRNSSLIPLGELAKSDLIDGDLVLAMNDVGAFVLTIKADSPMAPYFAAGNGVIISRDRGDGSGAQTLLSGPIWHLERRLADNVYVIAGPDDLFWLKARRADPVTSYPYSAYVLGLSGLLRYYRLGESSGTSATDAKSAANGTYTGGVTLVQPPLIDDANTSVLFDGTTGYVNLPTTSLPVGNGTWSVATWFQINSNPVGHSTMWFMGAVTGVRTGFYLQINAGTSIVSAVPYGGTSVASAAVSLNTPHLAVVTYDGTTLRLYIDGTLANSGGPGGAMAITYTSGGASIAANYNNAAPSQFFPGTLDECALWTTAISSTTISTLYATGLSRYASSAYDTRTAAASTTIRQYVDVNAGPSALSFRRVTGLALAADPAIGSSTTGNERFVNLLAACQQLAVSGGDLGFRLIQTDVGTLTFTIYQPASASNAIFSRELGNLLDATYTLDGPVANQYVGGGSGQGTARTFVTGQDSSSIATWGLVEGFLDARDTADTTTISQRISAQLAQDAQQTNLTITPVDTAALQFGRDYGLGDIVSVQIDGETITDKIRQLHITLNSSDQELVSPGIGNAGAGQIAQLFDAKQRALAAVKQALARLQAAQ